MRRGRLIGNECQLQVVDDSVHHGGVGEESDDAHLSAALRAEERVNFIHLTDHLSPFGAQELHTDKTGQDLVAEKLGQPRVVERGDLVEKARFIHL
jgi:hypothetical protein